MKLMSKLEWDAIEEGKLEKSLTVEEFKSQFEVSDSEFKKALAYSCDNEYGTTDLCFVDEESDMLIAEYDGKSITHLHK